MFPETLTTERLRLERLSPETVDAHGGQYEGVVRNRRRRPDGRVVDQHRFTVTHEQYADATG